MTTAGATDLYSIVYVSRGTRPLSESDLDALLADARYYNEAVGVTGLLAYEQPAVPDACGTFIQCVEGNRDVVLSLFFERIEPSSLHTDIQIKHQGPVEARSFAGWSMACKRVAEGYGFEAFNGVAGTLGPPPAPSNTG